LTQQDFSKTLSRLLVDFLTFQVFRDKWSPVNDVKYLMTAATVLLINSEKSHIL